MSVSSILLNSLDKTAEPESWSDLNVNSIRTKVLSVNSSVGGDSVNFYLNNDIGDDVNNGLSPSQSVRTWTRLMDIASLYSGSVCVINLDGAGDFDPSVALDTPAANFDSVWDFGPLSNFDACVVRGAVENPLAISALSGADAAPGNAFKQFSGLDFLGVDYSLGIAEYTKNGLPAFEAVSSIDSVADPNSVLTVCGNELNAFGGTIYTLAGCQIRIESKCLVRADLPLFFQRCKVFVSDSGTGKLTNNLSAINFDGCLFDINSSSFFSGDYKVNGCRSQSTIGGGTFFTGSNLESIRNCHIEDTRLTLRQPNRMTNCRFTNSKVRCENTFIESFNVISTHDSEDNFEFDSALYDMFNLDCVNSSTDVEHHCIDAERSNINIERIKLVKPNGSFGNCINARLSNLDMSESQSVVCEAGSNGVCLNADVGSYVILEPENNSGGETPDFKYNNESGGFAISMEEYSKLVVNSYSARNAGAANPASILSTAGTAVRMFNGCELRLPQLLSQSGDLQLSSTGDAIELVVQSRAIFDDAGYTNVGAGANIVKVGGQAAVAVLTSGFNAADLATLPTNQGCSYWSV